MDKTITFPPSVNVSVNYTASWLNHPSRKKEDTGFLVIGQLTRIANDVIDFLNNSTCPFVLLIHESVFSPKFIFYPLHPRDEFAASFLSDFIESFFKLNF